VPELASLVEDDGNGLRVNLESSSVGPASTVLGIPTSSDDDDGVNLGLVIGICTFLAVCLLVAGMYVWYVRPCGGSSQHDSEDIGDKTKQVGIRTKVSASGAKEEKVEAVIV